MRAGEAQMLAYQVNEQCAWLRFDLYGFSVDDE
jgi:hypothetical protein